jgi:hypothetical protein
MTLLKSAIIAPDTSHWADWIDAAIKPASPKGQVARDLHQRLLDQGRIPFLSWHHLEELLVVDDPGNASARLAFLQSLPLMAWMRMPGERILGGIIDILAAEAIAYDSGCRTIVEVRDHVRSRLLATGTGLAAIGEDGWVWDIVRPIMRERRQHIGMVSALSGMRTMDESQTVGQLCEQEIRAPADQEKVIATAHRNAFARAKAADPRRSDAEALEMANEFVLRVMQEMPAVDVTVRQLLVETYGKHGIDEHEIRDDCTIAELSELGTFRLHLHVVAKKAGVPFERLKRVSMQSLPSWRIANALKRHGQERPTRPGSDVNDQYLAVLAAYTDVLFVDKRTLEDFRRVKSKEPELNGLFGTVTRASVFEAIAD